MRHRSDSAWWHPETHDRRCDQQRMEHRPQVVFGTEGRPEQNEGRTNNAADSQSTDIDTPASSHAQPVAPSPAVTQ
ncbi:MAG: hypothetical protein H7Z17_06845 [Fuerstia sp.]|nr:hypothetical protein [Fuerstiella sp.]